MAKMALTLVAITALALLVLWMYRLVQYRKAVQRSQARWLGYEPAPMLSEDEMGLNWPSFKPILLSPIPEEKHESGRESENEMLVSARMDPRRLSAISVLAYGSLNHSVVKTAKV